MMAETNLDVDFLAFRQLLEAVIEYGGHMLPGFVFLKDHKRKIFAKIRPIRGRADDLDAALKELLTLIPCLGIDEVLFVADTSFIAESRGMIDYEYKRLELTCLIVLHQTPDMGDSSFIYNFPYMVDERKLFWLSINSFEETFNSPVSGRIPELIEAAFNYSDTISMQPEELKELLRSLGHMVFDPTLRSRSSGPFRQFITKS